MLLTTNTSWLLDSLSLVGKGRDVGLNQIALFEGKVAGGNGEQVLSRDVYRLGGENIHIWFDSDSINWVLESLPKLLASSTWACVKLDIKRTLEIAIDSNRRGEYIRILEARKEGNRFIHIPFGTHNDGPNLFLKAILSFVKRARCLNKAEGFGEIGEVGESGAIAFEVAVLGETVIGPVLSRVENPTLALQDTLVLEEHLKVLNEVGDPLSDSQSNKVLSQEVVESAQVYEQKSLSIENLDIRVQSLGGQDIQHGNTTDLSFCSVEFVEKDFQNLKENTAQAEPSSSYNSQYPQLPRVCLSPFAAEFIPLKPNSYAALFDQVKDLEEGSPFKDVDFDKIDDGNMVLSNIALEDIWEEREGPILYTHSEGEDKAFNDNILKPL
ncbi:unnamed protein product [Cuscuta campestris]|uniref:Glycosyl transferase 48 domain-containing protein n=1 Tax=Cuscuta campestris TaxID=132261 RepID=A0A484NJJ4_9ASTE|nr:unnamed protein product [Cuscuta campestris]